MTKLKKKNQQPRGKKDQDNFLKKNNIMDYHCNLQC